MPVEYLSCPRCRGEYSHCNVCGGLGKLSTSVAKSYSPQQLEYKPAYEASRNQFVIAGGIAGFLVGLCASAGITISLYIFALERFIGGGAYEDTSTAEGVRMIASAIAIFVTPVVGLLIGGYYRKWA